MTVDEARAKLERSIVEYAEACEHLSGAVPAAAEIYKALDAFAAAVREEELAAREGEAQRVPADVAGVLAEFLEGSDDEDGAPLCRRCGDTYSLDPGKDATPWCHPCAQEAAAVLADYLSARRCEEPRK